MSEDTVSGGTVSGGAGDTAALIEKAEAWLDQDPDKETRKELEALISGARKGQADAVADLHSRFDSRLEFGTAGLRGELAAGPNRMNRVLVSQAAAGLAAFLLGREQIPSVVIGYDGRKNSRIFAQDTAELMAGAGVRAILLPRLLPTPVLAFAVRFLNASGGVMVTASHNPPNDNGYKVYLGGADEGSQIVPPSDAQIEAEILKIAAGVRVPDLPRSDDYQVAGEEILDEYVRRTVSTLAPVESSPKFVYTAMHGVGWETASRVFEAAGFEAPTVVKEQIEPDPRFPTVAFPNPEEPGALDLAFKTATEVGAEFIIANDPDADRLGIAIPESGGWRRLTGNEVGSLLGWKIAQRLEREAETVAAVGGDSASCAGQALACSIVSSPALAEVARQYHLDFFETLTGFKWVSRVPCLAFGYEEALGYLVDPKKVRDKDGISAAAEFLSLAAELKARNQTIADHLLAFAEKFGAFASGQISIRVGDLSEIPKMMASFRSNPPTAIGEFKVERIDDFANGYGDFPPSDILRIALEGGSRVIIRPSGTEPKLKVYLDAHCAEGSPSERIETARSRIAALDAALRPVLGRS